jgi:anaerobic magnesium-protoporphyrin IX monomethyl ester cyclase
MAAEYTEANLTAVMAAKLALATGTRKVSFSMGDKSFTYAQADMEKLESLER